MSETRLLSNQNVAIFAGPDSAFADYKSGTNAEFLALTNYSEAAKWDGFDFNLQTSDQKDDRSLTDGAGAQSRGYTKASGSVAWFTPKQGDTTSITHSAQAVFGTPRAKVAVVIRDGKSNASALAAGDEVNVFRTQVDVVKNTRGDVSYSWDSSLVLRNDCAVNYIIPASSPTAVALTPSSSVTASVGDIGYMTAAYQGRNVTVGAIYTSSNPSVVSVTKHGVWQAIGAGTATVTPSIGGSAAGTPRSFTVS